jgi:hypothetical protein
VVAVGYSSREASTLSTAFSTYHEERQHNVSLQLARFTHADCVRDGNGWEPGERTAGTGG